jgi:very-short-patch-repair endonuclease
MNRDAIPNVTHKIGSEAEEALALQFRAMRIAVEREHEFHPQRKWRFDFAIPEKFIAIEIEGGIWKGGRHTRGSGFAADLEKYEEAQRLGWWVYRCSPEMVKNGRAIETVQMLMEQRG